MFVVVLLRIHSIDSLLLGPSWWSNICHSSCHQLRHHPSSRYLGFCRPGQHRQRDCRAEAGHQHLWLGLCQARHRHLGRQVSRCSVSSMTVSQLTVKQRGPVPRFRHWHHQQERHRRRPCRHCQLHLPGPRRRCWHHPGQRTHWTRRHLDSLRQRLKLRRHHRLRFPRRRCLPILPKHPGQRHRERRFPLLLRLRPDRCRSPGQARLGHRDWMARICECRKSFALLPPKTNNTAQGPTSGQAVPSTANAQTYWDQVGCKLFGTTNTYWYTLNDNGTSSSS